MCLRRVKYMSKSLKRKTIIELFRCRKCQLPKKADDYFKATDIELDANGRMSICKICCREILDKYMLEEQNMEKAFLRICRRLNIIYDEQVIVKGREKMEELKNAGKEIDSLLGFYLRILFASKTENKDLTFHELTSPLIVVKDDSLYGTNLGLKELEKEWGIGLINEDYIFLEEEMASWMATHRSDTKAEKTLLKEICWKQLEIRRARLAGDSTENLVKQLQELLKTAAIDPSKANAAGQGKNLESFSAFIKMIEETEPAEYFADKELFKDFDNIGFYFEKYVTRPLKNFVMGSRDFNVETEKEGDDEDDSFDISDMGIEDDVPVVKEKEIKKEE